jgi:hypothetical protein
MNPPKLATTILVILWGIGVAAFLLLEDGTALGKLGLTSVGVGAVIAVAAAVVGAAILLTRRVP